MAKKPTVGPGREPDSRTANAVDRHIGRRVREIRLARQISQEQLAGVLGVTFQQVQKYEKGVNRIAASRLREVALALNASFADFFQGLSQSEGEGGGLGTVERSKREDAARKIIDHAAEIEKLAKQLGA